MEEYYLEQIYLEKEKEEIIKIINRIENILNFYKYE